MRFGAIVALVVAVFVGSTVYSRRTGAQQVEVIRNVRPAKASKLRVEVVGRNCPHPARAERRLKELEAEVRRLAAEKAVVSTRAAELGPPLPERADLAVDRVRPELESLLEGQEVRWHCDTFPCAAAVIFEPGAETDDLRDAIEARFPSAVSGVGSVGEDGWPAGERTVGAEVMFVRVLPEGGDRSGRRLWYHHRLAGERMLRDLHLDPPGAD